MAPTAGRLLLGMTLLGLLAGLMLAVLTALVSQFGPQVDGWSLRGNGALIVPFDLGSAILAGAWTGLARHAKGDARWPVWGIGAALVGVALMGAELAPATVFGPAAGWVAVDLSGVALGWPVVAALLAAMLSGSGRSRARTGLHLAAGVLFAIALLAGLWAVGLLVVFGPALLRSVARPTRALRLR